MALTARTLMLRAWMRTEVGLTDWCPVQQGAALYRGWLPRQVLADGPAVPGSARQCTAVPVQAGGAGAAPGAPRGGRRGACNQLAQAGGLSGPAGAVGALAG